MSAEALPYDARLEAYERRAKALLAGLAAGDDAVAWRFKWEHPRFREKTAKDVQAAALGLEDARTVVAREYGFEDWPHLAAFTDRVRADPSVARFEDAVEAVVAGDMDALRRMLAEDPGIARARSARRHHATLLHYVAANGVEGHRQQTPPNAVEVAELLLESGAEVDALADMYDERCTTMSMLVSSTPPAEAGLQIALAEALLDHGAAFEGAGSKWDSALMTALTFGHLDTARALAARGAPVSDLPAAAGLGLLDEAARLLPAADGHSRHVALALAAQQGHALVVRLLLDHGEDPSRRNPDGYHSHATPLHHAVWCDRMEVVRLLVERGARLDMRDEIYDGTPLDWAVYGKREEIAEYLRGRTHG
jgi:ankyrin repeat protein